MRSMRHKYALPPWSDTFLYNNEVRSMFQLSRIYCWGTILYMTLSLNIFINFYLWSSSFFGAVKGWKALPVCRIGEPHDHLLNLTVEDLTAKEDYHSYDFFICAINVRVHCDQMDTLCFFKDIQYVLIELVSLRRSLIYSLGCLVYCSLSAHTLMKKHIWPILSMNALRPNFSHHFGTLYF